MTDLLAIGSSGLRAYRTALAATGDNIANAQTPGYVRRSARLSEVTSAGSPNILYRNRERFDGVDVSAIERATDMFRTSQARLAAGVDGRAQALSDWLGVAEAGLDGGANGVGVALTNVFAAGDRAAADPGSRSTRIAFLQAIETSADAFRASADGLAQAAGGVATAARAAVDATNADLSTLANINLAIRNAPPGSAAFVELSDQRDRTIDRIAVQTGADASISPDGSAVLTAGGVTLVSGRAVSPIALGTGGDGRLTFSTGGAEGGALAGLGAAADAISVRRTALANLAEDFATVINDWHGGGQTVAGAAGAPLLATNGFAVIATDPDALALADTGGTANGNALALSGVRQAGNLEVRWNDLVAAHAQATLAARNEADATAGRRSATDAARDAVEGVDLDREAADLLRFQQAYQGAARVIQMAKETVDTILRLF